MFVNSVASHALRIFRGPIQVDKRYRSARRSSAHLGILPSREELQRWDLPPGVAGLQQGGGAGWAVCGRGRAAIVVTTDVPRARPPSRRPAPAQK